jgi:hypothetical protein
MITCYLIRRYQIIYENMLSVSVILSDNMTFTFCYHRKGCLITLSDDEDHICNLIKVLCLLESDRMPVTNMLSKSEDSIRFLIT